MSEDLVLPPLPDPYGAIEVAPRVTESVYSAEQVRQAQREARAVGFDEGWQAGRRALRPPGTAQSAMPPKQSIDTPELHKFMDDYDNEASYGSLKKARAALIAYIDGRTDGTAPTDPMDWPIPCDVTVGAGTIRKGCKLRTLVMRMESLHRMATAAWPKLTPEQKQANWDALIAAAPSPLPPQEEDK